jgi:hypothetical protein
MRPNVQQRATVNFCLGNRCSIQDVAADPEFSATVTMPPVPVIDHLEEASRAGDEQAQVLFMWVFRLMERYKENGCGEGRLRPVVSQLYIEFCRSC